jgi:hypothetical protein
MSHWWRNTQPHFALINKRLWKTGSGFTHEAHVYRFQTQSLVRRVYTAATLREGTTWSTQRAGNKVSQDMRLARTADETQGLPLPQKKRVRENNYVSLRHMPWRRFASVQECSSYSFLTPACAVPRPKDPSVSAGQEPVWTQRLFPPRIEPRSPSLSPVTKVTGLPKLQK